MNTSSLETNTTWSVFGIQKQGALRTKQALLCAPGGLSLSEQMAFVQANLNPSVATQHQAEASSLPQMAVILPMHLIQTFQIPCLPGWGRQDMMAECCLEAVHLLKQPMTEWVLEFELLLTGDGRMLLDVRVCQQAQVKALRDMCLALRLNLKALTAYSKRLQRSEFWNLSLPKLTELWRVLDARSPSTPSEKIFL